MDHVEQLPALVVVLKLPLRHVVQRRLVVVVPLLATYSPAVHTVFEVHAVAEFPSWSQVLDEHVVFGVSPPGQKVPAGQARHAGGLVAVPGEVCSVPAGQSDADKQEL